VVQELATDGIRHPLPATGGALLLATDGAARFARVGARFFGESIDAADVELIDL